MYGSVCEAPKLGFSEACSFADSSVCVRNVSCMLSGAGLWESLSTQQPARVVTGSIGKKCASSF